MLIEAAKGGHTNVVNLLLDYPNNCLSSSNSDLYQQASPEVQVGLFLVRSLLHLHPGKIISYWSMP